MLQLSEDAYQGDAQFTVTVDGKALGAAQSVTASHARGGVQNFAFGQAMAAGTHDVAVSFLNDAWGGTVATDRNLYVNAVDANGAAHARHLGRVDGHIDPALHGGRRRPPLTAGSATH